MDMGARLNLNVARKCTHESETRKGFEHHGAWAVHQCLVINCFAAAHRPACQRRGRNWWRQHQ